MTSGVADSCGPWNWCWTATKRLADMLGADVTPPVPAAGAADQRRSIGSLGWSLPHRPADLHRAADRSGCEILDQAIGECVQVPAFSFHVKQGAAVDAACFT